MKKRRQLDKFYTHFDFKKKAIDYEQKVKNPQYVKSHGFYPFIHFQLTFKKFTLNHKTGKKEKKPKHRNIKYAAHIDRFIYQYYGNEVNEHYNRFVLGSGINRVSTAYRSNFKGKNNIHFAKEVYEFIAKKEKAYLFLGDFSDFFDNIDHSYLKDQLQEVLCVDRLPDDHYAVFKNVTKYSYIRLTDIANYKQITMKDMKNAKEQRYFTTQEFQVVKKRYLKKNEKNYGIPQGSSISSVYSNVYMMEFDKVINNYVTARKGLYRRYCDDFIIILPNYNAKHTQFIKEQCDAIPRLNLQPSKTEEYIFDSQKDKPISSLNGNKHSLNYLGFSFDGLSVKIRDKSLFKYYSRAYKKARVVLKSTNKQREKIILRKLYKLYTYLGEDPRGKQYGNFLTYARKADAIFNESTILKSEIGNQVKRHWKKIGDRLLKK